MRKNENEDRKERKIPKIVPGFGGLDMFLAIACAFASAALYQSSSPPDFWVVPGETAFCCTVVTNGSVSAAFFSTSAIAGFGWLASTGS